MLAVFPDQVTQMIGQRIQALAGFHGPQIGHDSLRIVLSVDGVAIFIIDIPCHFTAIDDFHNGNSVTVTHQIYQNNWAIKGIPVIETILTHHHRQCAHEVRVSDLSIIRQMGHKRHNRQIDHIRISFLHTIRDAEHIQNRIINVVGSIDANDICLTQFGHFQCQDILLHTRNQRGRLCQGIPVLDFCTGLVCGNLVNAGLRRLKQEIGNVHRLQIHIGITHLQVIRLECRAGSGGGADLDRLAADTGGHHDCGRCNFCGQLQVYLLISHIFTLENQLHGVITAQQHGTCNTVFHDQHMGSTIGGIQAHHNIIVGFALAVHYLDGIGGSADTFRIFQNDHDFQAGTECISILLSSVTLRRENGCLIATCRQHEHGIAIFIGSHIAVAHGNHDTGYRQAVIILHMECVGNFLFLIQTDDNFLRRHVGSQQILNSICRESIRENQLDHVASLRKQCGNNAFLIGDQNHRLAIDRESGGDAGHRQAFHVFKS